MKNLLLIIDPQVDFINGSLPVPGSEECMGRLARFIERRSDSFEDVLVTLDSHQPGHISFRSSWLTKTWENEKDITEITPEMIGETVKPKYPELDTAEVIEYITNRIPGKKLDLWPDHCVIGTPGHCIWPSLKESFDKWSEKSGRVWKTMMKGNRSDREMYSAILCDGEKFIGLSNTPKIDSDLITSYDKIYIAGIAKDFCVAETVKDLMECFGAEIKGRLIFLDDCMPIIVEGNESTKVYNECIEKYGAGMTNVDSYNSLLMDYLTSN